MNCSTPGLPVQRQLPESTQTHVHSVSDAVQPSHSLSSPSPPTLNLSQPMLSKVFFYTFLVFALLQPHMFEKTLESPLDCKEIQPVHPKGDQSWVFIGRTDVEAETPILWPPHVSWERLRVGGEGDDREWDGWTASLTLWTWVWVDSGSWRWTGRPGVLQFMRSQRVGHDWATELKLKTTHVGDTPSQDICTCYSLCLAWSSLLLFDCGSFLYCFQDSAQLNNV